MRFYGKSPVRISLCNGGDTDYYINEMGWSNLINATLSSISYICEVEPRKQDFIEYSYKNIFSRTDNYRKITDLNLEKDLSLITKTIQEVNPDFKGSIKVFTNAPEKSGLGGSSSLVVSLIKALMKTKSQPTVTPEKIARLAYKIERILVGIKGGYQDQWAAAFSGGVNYLEFRNDDIFIEPLWLPEKLMTNLENKLVLFFIEPRKGDSGNVHEQLEKRLKKNKKEDITIMLQRRDNVLKTRDVLLKGNLKKFSELLNTEQKSKEKLMKDLLTEKSSKIYNSALSNGAIAGKVSGAGSGGCAFFIYPKNDKNVFIHKMSQLGCKHLPLKLQRVNTLGEM